MKDAKGWAVVVLSVVYGLVIIGAAQDFGFTSRALINLPMMGIFALCGLWDFHQKIIPDWLTLPGLGWVLGASALLGMARVLDALLGVLICGGILFAFALLSRGSIGGGDVKLTALIGAALGWQWGFGVLVASQAAAAALAIPLILARRKRWKDVLPFGAFLATLALLALRARPI